MKIKIQKLIVLLIALVPIAFTQSCAPNLARTNARIEKVFNLNVAGAYNHTSKDDLYNEHQDFGQIEIDAQVGGRKDNNFGFAGQIKMGLGGVVPGLDLYVELPSSNRFYYGIGAELIYNNGGYVIGTYYPSDHIFITFTGRVLYSLDKYYVYNPQLSVGLDNEDWPNVSIFSGYDYFTDEGLDGDMDLGEHNTAGNVKHLIYAGVSFLF